MVLVDTSVWIEYFKGNTDVKRLDTLINTNNVCINELILAELVPSINVKKEQKLKELLFSINRLKIDINWNQVISIQTTNLKNGINKVGISDIIILQNAIMNNVELYTIDKHFSLMSKYNKVKLYNTKK
jgi:predicted nucleic acid-binding protein